MKPPELARRLAQAGLPYYRRYSLRQTEESAGAQGAFVLSGTMMFAGSDQLTEERSRGRRTIAVVPSPSLLLISIAPRDLSVMALQMARPKPVPPVCRLREGSLR